MTSKWCKYIIRKSVNFLLTYQKSNEWVFFLQKQQVRKYPTNQTRYSSFWRSASFKLFKFLSLYNFPSTRRELHNKWRNLSKTIYQRGWKQCLCKILEGKQIVFWYFWIRSIISNYSNSWLRVCLHEGGETQVGVVTRSDSAKNNPPRFHAILQPRYRGMHFLTIID